MAFKIYKCSDRIEVNIEGISIFISPLSYQQKMNLQDLMLKASNGDMNSAMAAVVSALKMSIKDIKGVQDADGNEYKLEFDNNELTEESVNDLLNMPISGKISTTCTSLLAGVPDKIIGADGKPLEGVSIIKKGSTKPGKK